MITLCSHHAAILMMPVARENSVGHLKLYTRNFTQGMSMSIKQWSLSEPLSDNHPLKCRKERQIKTANWTLFSLFERSILGPILALILTSCLNIIYSRPKVDSITEAKQ